MSTPRLRLVRCVKSTISEPLGDASKRPIPVNLTLHQSHQLEPDVLSTPINLKLAGGAITEVKMIHKGEWGPAGTLVSINVEVWRCMLTPSRPQVDPGVTPG